jgi:hypothetical protein
VTALIISMMAIGGIQQAWAHVDPGGSSGSGIGIAITVFRFDKVTPVLPGTVTECEKIWYQASLFKQAAPNAAFEGGTWTLTTPDGVSHPLGAVPCIGGTVNDPNLPGGRGATCLGSPSSIASGFIPYTIRSVDPANMLATTTIASSFAHLSSGDQSGGFASFGITIDKAPPCNDGNFCNGVETCDSNVVFGEFGERMGTCVQGTGPCTDNLFCSSVQCNETTDHCDIIGEGTTVCPDNLFCSSVQCNETTDRCDTTGEGATVCPDNLFCADVTCNETTDMCVTTDHSPQTCPDNLFCSDIACNEATDACDTTPHPAQTCPDNLFCADVTCNETTDMCVTTDHSAQTCPDNLFCADVTCNETTDMCVTTDHSPQTCPDNEFCANTVCNEASDQCDRTDISDTQCPDNPENVCEDNTCVEAQDACVVVPADPLPAQCVEATCRTPGFWKEHAYANPDKPGSQNITQAVINAGGGCLEVCGEIITNTDRNNADSVLEAMCISVEGNGRLQLVRQLTAAALNCVISGGGSDCAGTPLYSTVFSTCNAVCLNPASSQGMVTACIGEVDCLNNGGLPLGNGFCQMGTCAGNHLPCKDSCSDASACVPLPGNCHEQLLVNEELGLNFEPPGPAGSQKRCGQAKDSECKVIQPKESACGAGTKSVAPEVCE